MENIPKQIVTRNISIICRTLRHGPWWWEEAGKYSETGPAHTCCPGWPDINDVQTISLEKGDKKVHSEHRD